MQDGLFPMSVGHISRIRVEKSPWKCVWKEEGDWMNHLSTATKPTGPIFAITLVWML